MGFLSAIREGKFAVNVEFTPHNRDEVVHIANIGKGLAELNKKYAGQNIVFGSISLTQNPGGNLSYDHHATLSILREEGFPDSIEISPHITGKDMNVDAVKTLLLSLYERGVEHVLALTGDLSSASRGVFEVDSLGLLQLIRDINVGLLQKAKSPEEFAAIPILEAGAAVSPYKYTDGSLAMQYIKARKKIREGAAFLTLQSGWDSDRCEHLIKELGPLGVPIIGNALVVTFPVAKYMQTLPGCVVTEEFLAALKGKKLNDALERAGQQFAMFRQMGYAGVDLGKPGEFKDIKDIEKVVETALAIPDWREFKSNLTFAPGESAAPKVRRSAAGAKMMHDLFMEEGTVLTKLAKTALTPFENSAEKEGFLYRLFVAAEEFGKKIAFQCEHCGDCFLPENDYVCTLGQCEKGLPNPPCGDADPRGYCGNNENRICVGETLYYRLMHHKDMEKFLALTFPARKPDLQDSSSILNYYFGRDHTRKENPLEKSGLISIGEQLHGAMKVTGAAMKFVHAMGEAGFTKPNRGLMVLEDLVARQAREGADYLVVNCDVLKEGAPEFMRGMMRLVALHGNGVPPCIDAAKPETILAGLQEWFSLREDLRPPLVNSIPYSQKDAFAAILEMRRSRPFRVVFLLLGPNGLLESPERIHEAAREMFAAARSAGFGASEIFFDPGTMPLTKDNGAGPEGALKSSHTRNAFLGMHKIANNPEMAGVHCVMGVANWARGIQKRRIGHLRAFIEAGKKHGLDAAIVDTAQRYGVEPAAPELLGLVETVVAVDGSEAAKNAYEEMLKKAQESAWI